MKQNLLKFLLFAILLSLTSCLGDDVDIESNRRLLVKGKITDTQGEPLSNISVVTSAFGDELGRTNTDADGNFYLVSLDEQFDPLDILINVNDFYNPNINEDYASISYISTEHTKRVLYDLGTIALGKNALLNFSFINLPGDENILTYTIRYTPSLCQLPLNVLNPPENCDLAEDRSGILSATSENEIISIYSIQETNVIFEYSLNNNPTQTIEIPLTNLETNYVFEY